MSDTPLRPIELDFKSAANSVATPVTLQTFSSYSFERSVLTPAAAFRFTAPGIDASLRQSIRSGDTVSLYVFGSQNVKYPLGTGFIDETDTHTTPTAVEYLLTGRDTLGQLVDNSSVDAQNRIINTKNLTLAGLFQQLIANTRMPQQFIQSQLPNGTLLFQTNAGETKINTLQRYLDFSNSLVWSAPDGRAILGKPNFAQNASGALIMSESDPSQNNLLEARVRRNTNQVIRQIVTQLQTNDQVDPGSFTVLNNDPDVAPLIQALVGRSIYRVFPYGQGSDAVNQIVAVGNGTGNPRVLGQALSLREIARENVRVLDVECVRQGHLNEYGVPYNIDQVYTVDIDSDNVSEDMYVYACSYELTLDHGLLTRLHLCRLGSIVADSAVIQGAS